MRPLMMIAAIVVALCSFLPAQSLYNGQPVPMTKLEGKLVDNSANAFSVVGWLGDSYIKFVTTDSSEKMVFGNATTNPDFEFIGTGTFSIAGTLDIAAATLVATDLWDFDDFDDTMEFDGAQTMTGTAGELLTINRTLTPATTENGVVMNFTAADATSSTTGQRGLYLDNVASTEGLDALLTIDNSDTDDALGAGVAFVDAGGGITNTFSGLNTYVFGRPTSGSIVITGRDDDANATVQFAGGGTGGSLFGDTDSAWSAMGPSGVYSFFDAGGDHVVQVTATNNSANRILNIPALAGTRTLALIDQAQTFTATQTFGSALVTSANVGAIVAGGGAGIAAAEFGDGFYHRTVITGIDFTDAVVSAQTQDITQAVYTFPDGWILIHASTVDLVFTSATVTGTPEFGLGSTAGDDELTTTEENIMIGANISAISSGGTAVQRAGAPGLASQVTTILDGTDTPAQVFVNASGVTWAQSDDVQVTGSIIITWSLLGDD